MYSEKELSKIKNRIKDELEKKLKDIFPVEGQKQTLRIENVKFGTTKAMDNLQKQKDLKMKNRSLTIPVRAQFTLWDNNTGEKVDDKTIKIMRLPVPTQRLTYIVDGNEYQTTNQLRLRAGVYTKVKRNGEIETQVNVGNKRGFKLIIEPDTGIINIKAGSNINLYAFLKGMGVKDEHMKKYLGREILDKNRREKGHMDKRALQKFAKNILYDDNADEKTPKSLRKSIRSYFKSSEMDPETTEITLGKRFENVNLDMILESAKKLIKVLQNKEEEDDRDSLVFKKYLGVEDHLSEQLDKNIRKIKYSINNNVDRQDEIKKIVSPDLFNNPIKSFFTKSDLAATTELTNPLTARGDFNKVTIMGEGGITESHQLSDEMININPSSFGFLDPVHTPESQKIGANLHLSSLTEKEGNDLVTRVLNPKTGKIEKVKPKDMIKSVIAFPDQYDKKKDKFKNDNVKVMNKTEVDEVPKSEVDYVLFSDKSMFDHTTNLIPFLQSTQGNRAMMGGKMQEQALSLKHREEPLVQSAAKEGGKSFEELMGQDNALYAPVSGKITEIDDGTIKLKSDNGDVKEISVYDHFPLGGNSMINHEVKVKEGDRVEKGELIADSNFTRDGNMALGTNLNVAFMPYKGFTFEDGLVISESAAEKMTSEHLYTKELEKDRNMEVDKEKFAQLFPREIDQKQYKKLDNDGVIKRGQKVEKGDVLIAAMRKKKITEADVLLKNIHKNLASDQVNASVTWNKDIEGEVQEVVKHGNLIKVTVKTNEKAKEGDKVVGRYGNKGTISKVVPNNEMPHNEDGKGMDIILNPHTVPSRMNPSQLLETAAGKIADKTGEPYKVDNFGDKDYLEQIKKDMKKNNIKEKEKIIDPNEGELENPVFTGKQYFMKLKHQTKKKFSARSMNEGYDINEQPLQGGDSSGQAMDILTNYTLLAHGAKKNLQEMSTIKGTKNQEFWRAFQTGQPLPKPKPSFVFDKFISNLQGLGVNVHKTKNSYQLMAMTDEDVDKISNGEIKDATIVTANNLKEEKNGLFDKDITGGKDPEGPGEWAHIELEEPVPNPVFEKPIKKLLDLTQKEYEDILQGRETLDGEVGGKAIKNALSKIDIDKEIEKAQEEKAKTSSVSKKDNLNKKIRYLKGLKKTDRKPKDYVLNKMPVMPPKFRPVYELPNGSLGVSDINELYKHTILVNQALKRDKKLGLLNEQELGNIRQELYNSLQSIQGISDPITKDAKNRGRKGILRNIGGTKGTQPKNALFQNRVLRKRQDTSGRSIIVAGPELDVDTIGLPEEMAWKVYKPHIIRKMITERNIPGGEARDNHWKDRTPTARKVLKEVMEETPVILNRAPSLHKFSSMAFKPKLVKGKSIRLPSLVTSGFNADFDGGYQ